MALNKKDLPNIKLQFNELSIEEKKNNENLEIIEGLRILSYKVNIKERKHIKLLKEVIKKFDQSIVENTDGIYKIQNYKEFDGVTNKFFIEDGFKHFKINNNVYYYNILPMYLEVGKMKFQTNKSHSKKFFKLANELTEEEWLSKKEQIQKEMNENTKLIEVIEPKLEGYIIDIVAVVKEKVK